MKSAFLVLLGALVLSIVASSAAASPAMPGAEGAARYLVGFERSPGASERATLARHGANIRADFSAQRALAVEMPARAAAALAHAHGVAYVEPDELRFPLGLAEAQLTPSLSNGLYGLLTTKATTVHSRSVTGTGINACVADTSIDYRHGDIAGNYKGGYDFVGQNDPDPINDDGETHGTHVAGTVLGVNNTQGVFGVAYTSNLYYTRVLGPNGGTSSDIMEGVRWLIEQKGCKVVNLSLGGGRYMKTEDRFYRDMRAKGALVVAATGNDSATSVSYPARYSHNIAVGAVDVNNAHASFSNTGTNIDISAPGVLVLSSVPSGQGSESSVASGGNDHRAFGLEYAGKTTATGVTGTLVDCGLGQVGECPAAVAGNVALIQRGSISFADKVKNAQNAGAAAAVIYNNQAGDFVGTLGSAGSWIPAVSVSDTTGATLKSLVGSPATVVNVASAWDHFDGTSMATPHVTGIVALIWSASPTLSNSTVESHLFSTATDLGAAGYDTTYGHGLANADAAVAKTGR